MIEANLVDIHERKIYPARIICSGNYISKIEKLDYTVPDYVLPGLIDAHIHIESSMTTPGSFAEAAVSRGTTGVVSDPHEIANVLGIEGVKFMIADSEKVPLKFWFGAPSCVPATSFESAGAVIDQEKVRELLIKDKIKYLAEMMNFPGVINKDPGVMEKIKLAKELGKPIDGHAPGLSGKDLENYIEAGISTDHECSALQEALEKISLGMKILIREGSAARNLSALKSLLNSDPEMVMLCSDDMHPEMLVKRHLDKIIAQLICEGFDLFNVIRSCTLNPAKHYKLESGLLQEGDPADFIVVNDYHKMNVLETWINGEKVYDRGKVLFNYERNGTVNKFRCSEISKQQIRIRRKANRMRVIEAKDGELLTRSVLKNTGSDVLVNPDTGNDILKIVVKDRYNDAPPAVGFITGFGLKEGAFAGSVAHDSHNIICIGANDSDIVSAVNEIVRIKGGLVVAVNDLISSLPLPVAGLMSLRPLKEVATEYEELSAKVKSMGCKMAAPFMTLSFMALLVIPELKLSDKGLFDVNSFSYVPLLVG
jgi:adenine deaminase